MDRQHRKSVRRRGGRTERGPWMVDDVRSARGAVQSQSVQPGKRGIERHDAAAERVQVSHPTGQDRRWHWRPGQDIGFHQESAAGVMRLLTSLFPSLSRSRQLLCMSCGPYYIYADGFFLMSHQKAPNR